MTDLVTAPTLAAARRAINRTLIWRGTIARTSLTTPCRISYDLRSFRVEGLPSFVRIPRWKITMQDGIDLKPGDEVAVQRLVEGTWIDVGAYLASEMMQPATISVATGAFAVNVADASGALLLPFAKNADIRFKRPGIAEETTALLPVFIRRADQMTDPRREDGTPAYEWHMTYPLAAAYVSDSTKPGVNHYILWSEFPGVEPTIAEQPDRVTNQFFGLASLCFNTTG